MFRQLLRYPGYGDLMLEVDDSSLTDITFVARVEDSLLVDRIEKTFRQLKDDPESVGNVFDILGVHILNRIWYEGFRRFRFVSEILAEHRPHTGVLLSNYAVFAQ